MISLEDDSDGNTYQIWKQDQMNSCGVASTWMARGLVKQMSFAEGEWSLAQRIYRAAVGNALAPLGVDPDGPMCIDPRAHTRDQDTMANAISRFGFFASQLGIAIQSEGMRVEPVAWTGRPHQLQVSRIRERRPAIVLIAWNGGGGHFIVAAHVARNGRIVYLDPWDGKINEQPNIGQYSANYGSSGFVGEVLYLS